MKKVCALIGKYFGVIAVIFLIIGMILPTSFSWVLGKMGGISVLSVLLGVIMFGMGMTMSVHDFALVLKRPKDVFFGACAQYFVMPFLAYVLSTIFQLDPALTVGVVLVGTCPGGTSSNVITFMSKGDVPLSVTMTSVSTLISPIMTPLLTYLIIGQRISFDPVGMFLSILQIVIVPIALGLIVKSFLPKLADTATDYLPAVSALAISFLIAGIIGASRDAILNSSGIILLVVIFYMIGIDRWFCIGFGVLSAFSLLFGVFHLNKKYGPNGLMKLAAVKYHPSYIINRKRISSLFKKRIHEKYIKSRNAGK